MKSAPDGDSSRGKFRIVSPVRYGFMWAMKGKLAIALLVMLGMEMAGAETRVFTNSEGKTLEAELLSVADNKAVLKLGNGKQTKVSMETLSEADQEFIKTWWEENKDKIKPTDLTLVLQHKESSVRRSKKNKEDNDDGFNIHKEYRSSSHSYDLQYIGEFSNNSGRDLKEINVKYTIYKKTKRTQNGSGDEALAEVQGTHEVAELRVLGKETFTTDKIPCFSYTLSRDGSYSSQTEHVVGITVTLSTGGKEFLTVTEPANLAELVAKETRK